MSGNDEAIMAEFNEMFSKLEIIYPEKINEIAPSQYGEVLAFVLWNNDADMLMKVLDSQDIDPWDIHFVEDGLGEESQDKQSMIVFAARKKSWGCVAQLVERYLDCAQPMQGMAAVQPAFAEYEVATDPDRIDSLERFLHAVNSGYAKHLAKGDGFEVVFQPSYISNCPKATRFVFKSFAAIGISNKKLGPVLNKRLSLRQKALAAIASGDSAQLAVFLDALNANAVAYQAATRKLFESITAPEIQTFIAVSMSCQYPECVQMVLSKCMEFAKARSLAKSAGKTANESRIKQFALADSVNMVNKVLTVAKAIDQHGRLAKTEIASCIESSIGMAVFSVLSQSADREFVAEVKSKSEKVFTALKTCIDMACGRAEAALERQDIEGFIPVNDQAVVGPRGCAGMSL